MIAGIADSLGTFWQGLFLHLWQSTLVILPLFLIGRLLRNAPARLIHLLWSLAMLKLFLPLAIFVPLTRSLMPVLPGAAADGIARGAAVAQPLLTPVLLVAEPSGGGMELAAPLILVGSLLWLLGVLAIWRRLGLATEASSSAMEVSKIELSRCSVARLERLIEVTEIPADSLILCGESAPPHVAGLLRPKIYLPRHLLDMLSDAELTAILLHENAHRRRRDPLRGFIQRVCASMLFFYPLIGLVLRRLRCATELVCDERVLRTGISPHNYAIALARVVELGLEPAGPAATASLGGGFLGNRLRRITQARSTRMKARHLLLIGLALGIITVGTFLPIGERAWSRAETASPAAPAKPEVIATIGDAANKPSPVATESEFDVPPKPSKFATPKYPAKALKENIQGRVVVQVLVDVEGLAEIVEIIEEVAGHAELTEAVINIIPDWEFEPGLKDGEPIPCLASIPFEFKLDSGATKRDE